MKLTDMDSRLQCSRADRISFVNSKSNNMVWYIVQMSSVSNSFVSCAASHDKLFKHRFGIYSAHTVHAVSQCLSCSHTVHMCVSALGLNPPASVMLWGTDWFVCLCIFAHPLLFLTRKLMKAIMSRVLHTKDSYSCECVHHGNCLLILLHHCRQVTTNKTNRRAYAGKFDWGFWVKYLSRLFNIHNAVFIKLTFEVHLSNFIAAIYEAISSYYLTSSASHLTSISELLSGVFLETTDSDRFGTLTAVKLYWMAAFNHNTVLSCRQTAEHRCVGVCGADWASFRDASHCTGLCWSWANVISQR